jgi:prolipoprotein diacylglyceryltransferase
MLQELFRIPIPGFGSLPLFSYGLMLVIGFLLGVQLAKYLARRTGIDPEVFVNAGLLALVTGIVGARVSHILENLSQYTDSSRSVWENIRDAINIRSGGLTYYGGFLVAFPTLVWYALKKRVPLRLGMDIVAPCIMIGLGFGRIGCFLNGCCYGAQCTLPWAIEFPYHSYAYVDQYVEGDIHPPEALLNYEDRMPSGRPRVVDLKDPGTTAEQRALAMSLHALPVHPAQIYNAPRARPRIRAHADSRGRNTFPARTAARRAFSDRLVHAQHDPRDRIIRAGSRALVHLWSFSPGVHAGSSTRVTPAPAILRTCLPVV